MSRRRDVSDEEQALWRAVTRSIKPLKGRRPVSDPKTDNAKPKLQAPRAASPRAAAAAKTHAAPAATTPPLASLDRRARQRLARGTQSIDARLDLHGRTQAQAHAALSRFLRKAQREGAKTVLVITGKGSPGDERGERGVLKRQVPLWLSLPEFRSLVVGFGTAAIAHGGEGALYIRVRRGG